eukprot:5186908-Pleurochrysis_carterae.AAC.2
MPYSHVRYKHACNPNGDPTMRVSSVTPYNECYTCVLVTEMELRQCILQSVMPCHVGYKQTCNPNGESTMIVTNRGALQYRLQACLCPE